MQDIPPFSRCDGHPAAICGLNLVGLKRAKLPSSTIRILKKAFKIIFFQNHPLTQSRKLIQKDLPPLKELECLFEFISSSKRGISK